MKAELWDTMSALYNVYGCDYEPREMMELFFEMDEEERLSIQKETGCEYAEIKIERVFARLLLECRRTHPVSAAIGGLAIDAIMDKYVRDREDAIILVQQSDWCFNIANTFRILSRRYIKLFPGAKRALLELKKRGKKVFLLSNAQAIFTLPEIEALGLRGCFDRMYISSDHYVMKPDTAFMDILLDEEGLDRDRSVMVGDNPVNDAKMAILVGMDCILLNTSDRDRELLEKMLETASDKGDPSRGNVTILNSISELEGMLKQP